MLLNIFFFVTYALKVQDTLHPESRAVVLHCQTLPANITLGLSFASSKHVQEFVHVVRDEENLITLKSGRRNLKS
jgi:hypothetical protein